MPKKAGMEKWKKKRRQEYLEAKEYQYYIFCEGEQTEPKYFEGFKKLIENNPIYKDMILIEIEPCAAETMRVITAKLNTKNMDIQYHVAWSNECIEFWFILHFANYISNNHRTEYIRFLNDKFSELKIGKYQKNMDNIFEILMNQGNPKLASRYAKKIIKENNCMSNANIAPGTKVFKLVEELARYLPEEIRGKFIFSGILHRHIALSRLRIWQKSAGLLPTGC